MDIPHAAEATTATQGERNLLERLLRFQAVTAALLGAITPARVVDVVLEEGIAALGASAGLVCLVAENGEEMRVVGHQGYAEEKITDWARFPLSPPIPLPLSTVVRSGEPLFLEDGETWRRLFPELALQVEKGEEASVSLPLSAEPGSSPFGALYLTFPRERAFAPEERDFIVTLARQCALALERARLYEAERNSRRAAEEARRRMTLLAQASVHLATSLEWEETLETVAQLAVPEVADIVTVSVRAEAGSEGIRRVAVAHADPEKVRQIQALQSYTSAEDGGDYARRALESGETQFVAEVTPEMLEQNTGGSEHYPLLREIGLLSFVCVPLCPRRQGCAEDAPLRPLGAVTFATTHASGRRYVPADVEFLEELTRRAALAVDTALLYDASRREVKDRRRAEREIARLLRETQEASRQQRAFLRDVLSSVTEGRLRLCDRAEDLPDPLLAFSEPIQLSHEALSTARHEARAAAQRIGLPAARIHDLETAVGEVAMNAVVHAGGGVAQVRIDTTEDEIQVWVTDKGGGIAVDRLPRATLERGYSTGAGFGHGFWITLQTADAVWLLTGPAGTTVVLSQKRRPPAPAWLAGIPPAAA